MAAMKPRETKAFNAYRHALQKGLVKPKPSLSKIAAGNAFTKGMLWRDGKADETKVEQK